MADDEIVYRVSIDASGAVSGADDLKRAFQDVGAANPSEATKQYWNEFDGSVDELNKTLAGTAPIANKVEGAVSAMGATSVSNSDRMLARFSMLASQSTGMGQAMTVAFGRGATGMTGMLGSAGVLGAGIAAAGVGAGVAAWNLGAFALQEEATARFGKDARTSIDDLNESFKHLRVTLAQKLGLDVAVNEIALEVASYAEGASGNADKSSQLKLALLQDERAQIAKTMANANSPAFTANMTPALADLDKQIAALQAQLDGANSATRNFDGSLKYLDASMRDLANASDVGTAATKGSIDAMQAATGWMINYRGSMGSLGAMIWDTAYAQNALNDAIAYQPNHAPAAPTYGTGTDFGAQLQASQVASDKVTTLYAQEYQHEYDQKVALDKSAYDHGISLATQLADKQASDMKSATETMANAFQSFIDKGISQLDKLLGGGGPGGDVTAAGANGPFEGIYRVADVFKNSAKPGADTAKFAAQYFPGMGMQEAGAAAGVAVGQFRNYDLASLYKSGILNEGDVSSYFQQQQQAESNKATLGAKFGMTGMPGTFPLGAAAGAIKSGPGGITQPGAGIAQGLGNDIFATPLVSQLNALQSDANFIKASVGVGVKAAQSMSGAWVKEIPNTPWASAMEAAILASLTATFGNGKP